MELYLPLVAAGPDFSTLPQQLTNGLILGSIYALIALGYTMVYGVLRLINFAHGEVYMLGAYTALLVSWAFGFAPTSPGDPKASVLVLAVMLLASMVVCAAVGAVIEYLAYRPMRKQSRISALITAIGVSLLLQYGGALFLPASPPPTISGKVDPFASIATLTLSPPPADLVDAEEAARAELAARETSLEQTMEAEGVRNQFDLSPEGKEVLQAKQAAEREVNRTAGAVETGSITIKLPQNRLVILGTVVGLMAALWFLVMKTKTGRSMRAASHDFESASLMGINVNRVVSITFMIGSALAGAGAMMNATFTGTSLTTFYGLLPGVKAFVAAVLGGIGNIPGAVLGGLIMGLAEELSVWAGFSGYKDAVAFIILIVVLLFRPGGLLGSSKVEKV